MRRRTLAGWLMAAMLLAACASGPEDGTGAGGDTGGVTATPTGSSGSGGYGRGGYGTTTGSTGTGGSTGGGASADLTVSAVNFQFDPSEITIASGDVLEVRGTNPQTPHTFTVQGTGIDLAIDPQASETVTIGLEPGTYDVVCRLHAASQGMTATLTVT